LEIPSFSVGINIELGFQWQMYVCSGILLMTADVLKLRMLRECPQAACYLVCDVPVGSKS
jgi:hypothetical protein